MNRIDLTRTVTVPAGELSLLDALENAAQFLHDADADCALIRAARERLDAALGDVHQQLRQEGERINIASLHGVTITASTSATSIAINAGAHETLSRKANQLAALLSLFYGERLDAFLCLDKASQDSALWLAVDLGREVKLLAELATRAALQLKGNLAGESEA